MRIRKLGGFLATALVAASVAYATGPAPVQKSLEEQVRHEINMLPYYGVFDDLAFRVDGNKVTLLGQVWQPWLKRDTVNAVKRLEGVAKVDDQIEVLPLSSFDDRIRWQEVRAIYGYPALNRYGLGTHPSIHIIVKNGNVTLKGVVANTADRQLVYLRANGVPGVFSVTNELQLDPS
jgi:BON domain